MDLSKININSSKKRRLEQLWTQVDMGMGPTLKYQRVLNMLTKGISDGVWDIGDKLPTESELTHVLSFSYGTVQKAYRILEESGLVLRHRGSGSYVINVPHEMEKPWHCRFLDADDNILPVFPHIIGTEDQVDAPEVLQILEKSENVGRIDRKLQIGNDFTVFSRFYAANDIIQPLLVLSRGSTSGANFKSLLLREIGYSIVFISQTIVQSRINDDIAGLVGCHAKSIGFQVKAIARDYDSNPIYYQVMDVPPTTRRLLFESVYRHNGSSV